LPEESFTKIEISLEIRDGLRTIRDYLDSLNPLAPIGLPPNTPKKDIPKALYTKWENTRFAMLWIAEEIGETEAEFFEEIKKKLHE